MKRLNRKRTQILIAVGMFTLASSQVITHYFDLSDLNKGAFTGIGIGMVFVALSLGNFNRAKAG